MDEKTFAWIKFSIVCVIFLLISFYLIRKRQSTWYHGANFSMFKNKPKSWYGKLIHIVSLTSWYIVVLGGYGLLWSNLYFYFYNQATQSNDMEESTDKK
jgi:hypothetical protein|tara:strand:+ start:381 stop:677 length:297 start_codon:yes stop_codon:yes gene_type:complete